VGRTVQHLLIATLLAPTIVVAQDVPRLTAVATIGCSECGGPMQFATIMDVVLATDGSIITVGNDAPILRAFDQDGRVLWTSGRHGEGPGEYRLAVRAVPGPRGIQVLDMTLRRISRLHGDGTFASATAVGAFPAASAGHGASSDLYVLADNFRGAKTLHRWAYADSGRRIGGIPGEEQAGVVAFAAVAVAPSGELAVQPDINEYVIHRLDASGKVIGEWRRDIERVRRTPDEVAALERVRQRAAERAGAEAGRGRGGAPPLRSSGTEDLKPHAAIDGLRFDDTGRLWVRTMRGDHTRTILDVFSPSGSWLGEVVVLFPMGAFSLAGRWLAADVEADDGTRRVMIWEVR
jgi:hypothetical protein